MMKLVLTLVLGITGLAIARDTVDCAIVVPQDLRPALQPLAFWKTRRGLWTEIVTIESIQATYPGYDTPERIRNFLKDWFVNKWLRYVLLAGASCRLASAVTGSVPSDLYFSDLTGSWDGNRNHIYGEADDSIDFYSDIYVGRFPASDSSGLAAMVTKTLRTETNPVNSAQAKLLQSGDTSDYGAPGHWQTSKLYQPGRYELRDSLNAGFELIQLRGHGTEDFFGDMQGNVVLSRSDVPTLTNESMPVLVTSEQCLVGAFDRDCIGRDLMASRRGAVAAVLHARESWVQCASSLVYLLLHRFLAVDTLLELGRGLARCKDYFVPLASGNPYWRMSLYGWNLLGDPSLILGTDTARSLEVSHPQQLHIGPQNFEVTVRSGGSALPGAQVCLWKDEEVYLRARTGSQGQAVFAIAPLTEGEMLVTVTAWNCRPYQGACGFTTGITEPELPGRQRLLVIPNPTKGGCAIRSSTGEAERLLVASLDGRILRLLEGCQGTTHWDGCDTRGTRLRPGVYLLKLAGSGSSWTAKVILR